MASKPRFPPIAITGIGCCFPPGVRGPDAFFRFLQSGEDAISEVPKERWDWRAFYDPQVPKPGMTYARWGGFVEGHDQFDPEPFGISPREAAEIDPQQRMLLEAAWEALEDAGEPIEPSRARALGVFVGISTNDYGIIQSRRREVDPYSTTGTVLSIAANRISYCLNFTGPSMVVDTACSSSLVAVHAACRALQNDECDAALAGGVNGLLLPNTFIAFSGMTMLSPDGRCKAFDARANGFVRGEGAGIIVLQPLARALENGNRIYALIHASGVNQDARTSGMTMPSQAAQEALVRQVVQEADLPPRDVTYVEAHGTGTAVGDPIEARALSAALCQDREQPCLVGSVKTNIGHLEAGAGIAGLIKAALTLHHDAIPPNLHFDTPNPAIDFDALAMRVVAEPSQYGDRPHFAGVNSFGFGGTNAHVLLGGYRGAETTPSEGSKKEHLLVLSAKTAAALTASAGKYGAYLSGSEETVAALCCSAATRRGHHDHRLAVAGATTAELAERLLAHANGDAPPQVVTGQADTEPYVGFVYSGQGPQWWAMGRELFTSEPVFRQKIEECHETLEGWSLIDEVFRADEASSRMQDTGIAQPAIFALQVALTAMWHHWGIRPSAVIGHSVGEVAAVHEAGALSLADAMRVIYHRGRTMSAASGGRMLAAGVGLTEAEMLVEEHEGVYLGAINSPSSVTFSGEGEALKEIEAKLAPRGVFVRFLKVPYAFHSAQMDPVRSDLLASLADLKPQAARLPIISTVTSLPAEGSTFDAEYWWKNVRQTVRFAPGLERLVDVGLTTFLEIGPHPVLSASILETLRSRRKEGVSFPSLRRSKQRAKRGGRALPDRDPGSERSMMLRSLGALHALGHEVDWSALWQEERFVSLPTYAWQKETYWAEVEESRNARVRPPLHPILTEKKEAADPLWEGVLDPRVLPWLTDHSIEDRAVFAGAGFVDLLLFVAQQVTGEAVVQLEDLEIQNALFLPTGETPARLEVCVEGAAFEVNSRIGTDWVQHCAGKLRASRPIVDRLEAKTDGMEEINADDFYARLRQKGLPFGPAFRAVRRVWRREGEALGRIEVRPELADRHVIHPGVLDGCLQVADAALPKSDLKLQLPVMLSRVVFSKPPPASFWAKATLLDYNRFGFTADIQAFDDDGEPLFFVKGFQLKSVTEKVATKSLFYALRWRSAPTDLIRQPISLGGDLQRLTERLTEEARTYEQRLGLERYQQIEARGIDRVKKMPALLPDFLLEVARERSDVGAADFDAREHYEASSVAVRVPHRVLQRAVEEIVAAAPEGHRFRVLEIGGGTAGASTVLLPCLPEGTTYDFTDKTDRDFERVEQKLRDYPFVRFEQEEALEGLVSAYDLILANDRFAGEDLHRLLAPGGLLITRVPDGLTDAGFVDVQSVTDCLCLARSDKPLVAKEEERTHPAAIWLFFADERGVAKAVADRLEKLGQTCVLVGKQAAASAEAVQDTLASVLRPTGTQAASEARSDQRERRWVGGLRPTGTQALHVVHFLSLDAEDVVGAEALVCHSALFVTQALASRPSRVRLCFVTERARAAGSRAHPIAVQRAPLIGFGRTVNNEHPKLSCRMIDLGSVNETELDALAEELLTNSDEEEVALREEARYVQRLVHRADPMPTKRVAVDAVPCRLEIPHPGALDRMVFLPRPFREPGPEEIAIRVHAAAINFRDVMKALAIYPGDAEDADRLGDEGAGEVVAVGERVTRFAMGDRVMAIGGGYFGTYVTVPEAFALELPERMTFEEASTSLIAYITAQYALCHLGQMKAGEKVLIHAATGGVGLAAVQLAQAAGAEVFATAGSPKKRAFLKKLGVEHVMDSRSLDFAEEIAAISPGGIDIVLNSLAGEAIEKSLGLLGARGRFLEIGKRDIYANTRIGLRPFSNGLSFFAIDLGSMMEPTFMRSLLGAVEEKLRGGVITPLPHRVFLLGEAVSAFRYMTQAKQIGKIVLAVHGESVELDGTPQSGELPLSESGRYLIVGGTGGFGLAVARWLVGRGAKHVLLTSRSGQADEEAIAEMRRSAEVQVLASDVADEEDLAHLLEQIPNLRGVIHSAMVLDDGLIVGLDADRFHRVMRPKVLGAWNLQRQTMDLDLDFFVLFSSVSAVIGNPGQSSYCAANAFLDALASERKRLDKPALAINWGLLGEVGVVTRKRDLTNHFRRMGFTALSVQDALESLEQLMRERASRAVVLDVDWTEWAANAAGKKSSRRYALLTETKEEKDKPADEGRALRDALAATPDEALPQLQGYLRKQISSVLRTSATKIDAEQPLTELGFDSLMSVELIHRVERQLGVSLPTSQMMSRPSIARMADVLLAALVGKEE